jgi:hypothetical protein
MFRVSDQIVLLAVMALISVNAFAAEKGEGSLVPDPKTTPTPTPTPTSAPAPAAPTKQRQAISPYIKTQLEAWYKSDLPRGDKSTPGDYALHIKSVSNHLPVGVGDGYEAIICAGAGCPIKVPFTFSGAHLQRVKSDMAKAQSGAHCETDTAKCEMIGLEVAVVTMEKMVHNEKLRKISLTEQQAYAVEPEDEVGKATLQDCVDQTVNGISYLYILAQKGMMRHHSIIEPGAEVLHHWPRVKSDQGQIFAFDLYHRGEYGVPPYVSCENCP